MFAHWLVLLLTGKTIQTIALLAFLASERCAWGPHLIVVPTSTLLNWEMEFKRWCPALKVLTYYGGIKERKAKRIGWTKPNSFHVCVTSYQMVLADAAVFRRKKWHFLILDEAHYIKNYQSQRWQTLLTFSSRRRLLLTGTPLQNSLMVTESFISTPANIVHTCCASCHATGTVEFDALLDAASLSFTSRV